MGWLKKNFKKAVKFNKDVFGGGYIRDAFKSGGGKGPQDNGQEAAIREGYGAAQANTSQALAALPKQFERADKLIQSGQGAAIQAAQDYGAQANAASAQDLASRGLQNTTVMDQSRMGTAAGVAREVGNIQGKYAQLRAELGLRQGAEARRIQGNKAQLNVGMGQALAGQKNFQAAQQQQWELSQNPDAWLDSLLSIGGTAIGYGIGGPAGGAIGGQVAGQYNEGFGGS